MSTAENSIQQLYTFQDSFTSFRLNKESQDEFESQLEMTFNKFPNKKIVDLLYPLINNKLIFVGYPDSNKNFLLGQLIVSKSIKNIYGMVINTVTHDITSEGKSSNFNKIVNSMYYILIDNYLGLFVFDNKKVINDNMKLYDNVYSYFEHILTKNLKLYDLNDEKRKLFNIVCKYFFNVYYLQFSPATAYLNSIEYNNVDSAVIEKSKLENYTQITDLYNVLTYLNIVTQTPNVLKYNLTNGIGTFAYLTIHNKLHSLIAAIILSKYSHPNFSKLNLSSHKADEIESEVYSKYLVNLSIDVNMMKKFLDIENDKNIEAKI